MQPLIGANEMLAVALNLPDHVMTRACGRAWAIEERRVSVDGVQQ